jgi:hypothetical protein
MRAFRWHDVLVIVTAEDAQRLALAWLANDEWEPAVTKVKDAGESWRVSYNHRVYVETLAVSHALAGNLPVLVDKRTGALEVDAAWRPYRGALGRTLIGKSARIAADPDELLAA